MKVLALCGSWRRGGNTALLMEKALAPFKEAKWDHDFFFPARMDIKGCRACEGCAKTNRCVIKDDMQILYEKIREADVLIAGSPTYFYNVTSDMKRVIDRCYCLTSYGETDRSAWISELEEMPRKFAGTIAVCEQNSVEDLGLTSKALDSAFSSLGFRIVFSQKVLHAFKAGEVGDMPDVLEEAAFFGRRLLETCRLSRGTALRDRTAQKKL